MSGIIIAALIFLLIFKFSKFLIYLLKKILLFLFFIFLAEEFKYFLNTLKKDSVLILSGFLYTDVDYISKFLINHGLNIITSEVENNWAVLMVKFN